MCFRIPRRYWSRYSPSTNSITKYGRPDSVAPASIFSFATPLKAGNPSAASAIDALLERQDIVGVGMDVWGSTETNDAGVDDVLPVYTPGSIDGPPVTVCSNPQFGTFNRTGVRQYLRFDVDLPFFVNFPFGFRGQDLNWFAADGIPILPVDDAGRSNAYPLMKVAAHDLATGVELASLDVVLPVASEADCQNCHALGEIAAPVGSPLDFILQETIPGLSDHYTGAVTEFEADAGGTSGGLGVDGNRSSGAGAAAPFAYGDYRDPRFAGAGGVFGGV